MSTAGFNTKWPVGQLGDLCEISIGRTPARNRRDYWGPGSPWLSIADMNQGRDLDATAETITDVAVRECNCRLVPAGTVLLSFKLSIGKVGITKRPLFTNEAIAALPIKDASTLLPEFLYWALRSIDLTLGLDRAAKGLTLNSDKLHRIRIPLPPLPEQRRIAEILDKADALRAKRRAALAQLDTLTQSIFLDMFGDPATNPKGWPCKTVGSLASKFSDGPFGSNLKSEHYTDTGVRVIRLQNIGVGEFLNDDSAYISEHHFAKLKKHECLPGDVLVGTLGEPNLRACIQPAWLTVALNKADCVQLRPDERIANATFICALLNQPSTEKMAQELMHGQTRVRVSMGRLRGLEVPVPPLDLQREFARRVAAVEQLKAAQRAALAELDALFASLQHRVFRGELAREKVAALSE